MYVFHQRCKGGVYVLYVCIYYAYSAIFFFLRVLCERISISSLIPCYSGTKMSQHIFKLVEEGDVDALKRESSCDFYNDRDARARGNTYLRRYVMLFIYIVFQFQNH
jgi:hypothetical protein